MLRLFGHYIPRTLVILGLAELIVALAAVYLGATFAALLYPDAGDPLATLAARATQLPGEALLFAGSLILSITAMGLYQRNLRDRPPFVLLRIVLAFGLALGLLGLLAQLVPVPMPSGASGVLTVAFAFVGISSCRFLYVPRTETLLRRRALVVGAGAEAALIESLRRASDRRGIHIVGYVPLPGDAVRVDPSRLVERFGSLPEMVNRLSLDELIVAQPEGQRGETAIPLEELLECKLRGTAVLDVSAFHERQLGKVLVDALHVGEVLFNAEYEPARARDPQKRVFDILVSALVLLLTSPLMLITMLAIKIESGWRGTLIYRQRRVGLDGQVFEVLKFRSMREDAERDGARWAARNDDRVTRVGRFIRRCRIDELPQLVNVLRGDMSFVGPRPERPEFVRQLEERLPFYRLRHCVKPGITGWAQVCYPYGASFEDSREKLQYDLYYIKHHSLFLDLHILAETLEVVLWGKGAR
jgi:sugar transferase (PEP-CTERM system associated)